jgi:hypothetical protein
MAKNSAAEGLPAGIARAQEAFERWRSTRSSPSERIPEKLWALAVQAARRHGIWRAAQALRLDSAALKRRMPAAAGGTAPRLKEVPEASFVEIRAPGGGGQGECILELEDPRGARLRLRLPELDGAAIGAIARGFLQGHGA